MKNIFLFLIIMSSNLSFAQFDSLSSAVFSYKNSPKTEDEIRISTPFFKEKSTKFLEKFSIHHTLLKPKHILRPAHIQQNDEEFILISEGELTVTINGETKVLGAGSAFVILPGDEQMMNNLGNSNTGYYVLIYKAKKQRVRAEIGKSMFYNINDISFKAHDKGGRRDFMNRPTAMFDRLEMHITYLNEGLQSHAPHRHLADEIILLLEGDATMSIDEQEINGRKGDFFFLPSGCFHGIKNTGKGQASYFAFQFN